MPDTDHAPDAQVPPSPAAELGVLRYRLTVLLVHLAVRQPSEEALGDLRVLEVQLQGLATSAHDRWTSTSAQVLADLLSNIRLELACANTLGPDHLTTWEARR